MANKIQFSHFCGTEAKWNDNISSNKWDNMLVFGKIWASTGGWVYKIFAGKVYINNEESIDYLYNVADADQLQEVYNQVVSQGLDISDIINRLNTLDTSVGLLNTSVDLLNSSVNSINERVTTIENRISWEVQ